MKCICGRGTDLFLIVPKNCNFWGASFELIENLAILLFKKLQGFHNFDEMLCELFPMNMHVCFERNPTLFQFWRWPFSPAWSCPQIYYKWYKSANNSRLFYGARSRCCRFCQVIWESQYRPHFQFLVLKDLKTVEWNFLLQILSQIVLCHVVPT